MREEGRMREGGRRDEGRESPFHQVLGKAWALECTLWVASQSMSWFPSLEVNQHLELYLVKILN